MLTPEDCKAISNFILQKTDGEVFFTIVLYKDGERKFFGFGCEKCASDLLFDIAGELADKPHSSHKSEILN